MSIQRQATATMASLFIVYPKIEEYISLREASALITAMAMAGMFTHSDYDPYRILFSEVTNYVSGGIAYETSLRAIARAVNINEHIASKFIRGCFKFNNLKLLYPAAGYAYGSEYEAVVPHVTAQLAGYVMNYLVGDMFIPADSKKSNKNRREKYGTFYLFSQFVQIKNLCEGLGVKLYFLEVIDFIRSHPDRKFSRSEFASKKIFIDEVIDYAREYDEERFNEYRDQIETLLLEYDDCTTLPDFGLFKSKLKLDDLNLNLNKFKSSFSDLITVPPDSKSDDIKVVEYANIMGDDVMYIDNIDRENMSNLEPIVQAPIAAPGVQFPIAVPIAQVNRLFATAPVTRVDQQFEDDTARAIALSMQDQ